MTAANANAAKAQAKAKQHLRLRLRLNPAQSNLQLQHVQERIAAERKELEDIKAKPRSRIAAP